MSYSFAEGSRLFFSTTLGAAKPISQLTNAASAVATSVGHGFIDGDPILLSSGWDDATDSIYIADQQTLDTFALVDLDTTDLDLFPAGTGLGNAYKISNWIEIPQALDIQPQGGEQKFNTIEPLARQTGIQVPAGFNPMSTSFKMGWDPANSVYKQLQALTRSKKKVAFKLTVPGAGNCFAYGYVSVSSQPRLARGQVTAVDGSIAFLGRFTSYAGS